MPQQLLLQSLFSTHELPFGRPMPPPPHAEPVLLMLKQLFWDVWVPK
jgi:hypothetical protein